MPALGTPRSTLKGIRVSSKPASEEGIGISTPPGGDTPSMAVPTSRTTLLTSPSASTMRALPSRLTRPTGPRVGVTVKALIWGATFALPEQALTASASTTARPAAFRATAKTEHGVSLRMSEVWDGLRGG